MKYEITRAPAPVESITITFTKPQYQAMRDMFTVGIEDGWRPPAADSVRDMFAKIDKEINK